MKQPVNPDVNWNSKLNRQPQPDSVIFAHRGKKVKWPTLRGGYLTRQTVAQLQKYVEKKSIVFFDGPYRTNLNQWVREPAWDPDRKGSDARPNGMDNPSYYQHRYEVERAVFFEFPIQRSGSGGATIFILCWIGNFYNGAIFHCAPQYPQSNTWIEVVGTDYLDYACARLYVKVAEILYGDGEMDPEVETFIGVVKGAT